jgi:hypothetical protein
MDGFPSGIAACQLVQTPACITIVLERFFQMRFILVLLQPRQQLSQRGLCVSHKAKINFTAAP